MINTLQFRELVVRPALIYIGHHSLDAENLVLGTAIVESKLTYLKQLGGGPALGLFQMEPRTHDDIWENYLAREDNLTRRLFDLISDVQEGNRPQEMVWNLWYAAAMCRVFYLRIAEPLPNSVEGHASYWKRYYNTSYGKGKASQFVDAWNDALRIRAVS